MPKFGGRGGRRWALRGGGGREDEPREQGSLRLRLENEEGVGDDVRLRRTLLCFECPIRMQKGDDVGPRLGWMRKQRTQGGDGGKIANSVAADVSSVTRQNRHGRGR